MTGYQYDSRGRVTHVTHPDSAVTRYAYFPTGDLQKTWGSRTVPAEYTYDTQGRMKTLRTWKEFDQSAGSGLSGAATTTWSYDPQTGFLLSKTYPDSRTVSYAYDAFGRVETRTWARGVVTTYGYNNAGELSSVTYSDGTPAVSVTYNRVGQKESASGGVGEHTWMYDLTGRPQYDILVGEGDTWSWVEHHYDSAGRIDHKIFQPMSGSSWRYSYGYDDAGRVRRVTYNDREANPFAAQYSYQFLAGRVKEIHFLKGESAVASTGKSWDRLGRQTAVYSYNSSLIAEVMRQYEHNSANQITRATGEGFTYWDYGYDGLGQVTSAQKFLYDATAIDGHGLGYTYDDIGNRVSTATNGRSATWTSNAVNQYTSREVPGAVDVFGIAEPDWTVTVNGQTASRQRDHFYRELLFPNARQPGMKK